MPETLDPRYDRGYSVDYVLVGGPFDATGIGEKESQRRIFVCRPEPGRAEEPCARRILSTLARRAYRGPVTVADIDPLMQLSSTRGAPTAAASSTGSRWRSAACSWPLVFSTAHRPCRTAGSRETSIDCPIWTLRRGSRSSCGAASPTRSCCRWPRTASSVSRRCSRGRSPGWSPTQESGAHRELRRAVAAPSQRGRLGARSRMRFEHFDEPRCAMRSSEETELFLEHQVREDRSVTDLHRCRLHVRQRASGRGSTGIDGVKGGYFRRVSLDGPRPPAGWRAHPGERAHGDLLSHRTSPVLRGEVGAGEHCSGHAAPAPTARRAGPVRQCGDSSAAGAVSGRRSSSTGQTRPARSATPVWIRWGSPSRPSTPSDAGGRGRRRFAPIDDSGGAAGRHGRVDGPARSAGRPAGPARGVRGDAGREAADLRDRAGARVVPTGRPYARFAGASNRPTIGSRPWSMELSIAYHSDWRRIPQR